MSFTKIISTVAALSSIFGTSVLAWNLVNKQPEPPKQTEELEHKVAELEQRLAEKPPEPQTITLPPLVATPPVEVTPEPPEAPEPPPPNP